MNFAISKAYWRIFLITFFELVFFYLLYQAFMIILHSDSPPTWLVGDWLINYQGGFVRRGLTGEIAFQMSRLSGIDIVTIIVAFQAFLYLVFLRNTYLLSSKSSFSPLSVILICSPAFILFPVLDPIGAFRKEILLFALLSTLCVYLKTHENQESVNLFIYLSIATTFIILNHEMLIVYFPYLIAAFIISDRGLSLRAKKGILAIFPAISITILVMIFHRGNNQTVIEICNSLGQNLPLDCLLPDTERGAITFLGENLISAKKFVLESLSLNTVFAYGLTALLAFVPAISMYFIKFATTIQDNNNLNFWLVFCVLLAMVGSIPLFWVVADYGRLVYIHVTCLSILILMGIQEKEDKPLLLKLRQIPSWALAFLYVISWRLIHWKATLDSAFPIIAKFGSLFKF